MPPRSVGAIARLADDRALAGELGSRARARCVERYSFGSARRELFPLVDRLLARAGRR